MTRVYIEATWMALSRIVVFTVIASWIAVPISLMVWWSDLPEWEGTLFPVVEEFTITKMEPKPNGGVFIWGSLNKVRPCTFLYWNGYLVRAGGSERIVAVNVGDVKPDNRTSRRDFGPWTLDASAEEILDHRLVLRVRHSCHPGWDTVTVAFDDLATSTIDHADDY